MATILITGSTTGLGLLTAKNLLPTVIGSSCMPGITGVQSRSKMNYQTQL